MKNITTLIIILLLVATSFTKAAKEQELVEVSLPETDDGIAEMLQGDTINGGNVLRGGMKPKGTKSTLH